MVATQLLKLSEMAPVNAFFALIASIAIAIGLYSVWPEYNPLKKYGVVVTREGFESPSLVGYKFDLKGPSITGPDSPEESGEHLVIEFRDLDGDGVEEVLIQSETLKDSRTVIKVLVEGGKAVGFHILETHSMCLGFSKEGFYCP